MSAPQHGEVTSLLARARTGDESAVSRLLEVAYAELRAVAANIFRDQPRDHTLQPTALVNEVCLRLLGSSNPDWNDRKHFIRAAATAMRNLLTDHARAKNADIRGGGRHTVTLDDADVSAPSGIDALILDECITRLSTLDPRLGTIFELRFLAGLTVQQTAEIAEVSERTVKLDTQFIRAWLQRELEK
jgi:RNA polymerase sigma factor (TIGR02999 family)